MDCKKFDEERSLWLDWFSDQELVEIFHQRQLAKLFTRVNIKKAKKFGIIDPTMRFIAATLF